MLKLLYHKNTDTWWINEKLSEFEIKQKLTTEKCKLGTIECNSMDVEYIGEGLYRVKPSLIPDFHKFLNELSN